MAITTNTFTINSGYGKSDLITQLESAFTWLGWHDASSPVTGIITGVSARTNGGYLAPEAFGGNPWMTYFDVEANSISGIGTGASFYVTRYQHNNGNVYYMLPNRCGTGYTTGEYLEIPAGSTGTGSLAIGLTVTASTSVTYGSTTTQFYTKHVEPSSTVNYGVLKHKIQENKKYGTTYRLFRTNSTTQIELQSGPSIQPHIPPNGFGNVIRSTGAGDHYTPRFTGEQYLDVIRSPEDSNNRFDRMSTDRQVLLTVSNSNSYKLDLNVYRSAIDPKFVVFSYKQPTLSSTSILNNNFATFILHNFESTIWDLDNVFLGGVTVIEAPDQNTNFVRLRFKTYPYGISSPENQKRCAEYGYDRSSRGLDSYYYSNMPFSNSYYFESYNNRIYYRNNAYDVGGSTGSADAINSSANYNAVIKGIPLNTTMVPVPYYLPDDFVLIDFNYLSPSVNVQQGDTVTISGSEVYTVITGIYNQTTTTKGLLFCARTV
jgi:hypothetical protein